MDHKGVVPLMLGCFVIIVATVIPCAAAINCSLSKLHSPTYGGAHVSGYYATDESVLNGRTMLENSHESSMDPHERKEVEALLSFKSHIKSDPSGRLSNWTADNSKGVCSWYGITCRPHTRRVVAIIFPAPVDVDDHGIPRYGLQLGGTISPSLGNLSLLQTLNLSNNNFIGRIPPEFGQLKWLEILDLSSNYFLGGSIPKALCNCTRLKCIVFSENRLTGGIPTEFGRLAKLEQLNLYWNIMRGSIPNSLRNCPIASVLSSLRRLSYLDVRFNNFSGPILPFMSGSLLTLSHVDLSMNHFNGPVPSFLGSMKSLSYFDLSWNNFTGIIPPTLGNCTELMYLGLSHKRECTIGIGFVAEITTPRLLF